MSMTTLLKILLVVLTAINIIAYHMHCFIPFGP